MRTGIHSINRLCLVLGLFSFLAQSSFGQTFYGNSGTGGASKGGTIFHVNADGTGFTTDYQFQLANGGANADFCRLLKHPGTGKIYGVTAAGGDNGAGVLYEYDPSTNIYLKKFDFAYPTGGAPNGSLVLAGNGKIYGMATGGGTNSSGVIYEYNPTTGSYVKKIDFGGTNGFSPFGGLTEASNLKLYGVTVNGGSAGNGVLFEYDPATNIFVKKIDFNGPNDQGAFPLRDLTKAPNGNLYGMTLSSLLGGGILYSFNPTTGMLTPLKDFDPVLNGAGLVGSLMLASDNKFYGVTQGGGINGKGVLFTYDPVTNIYTKLIDFDGTNGTGFGPELVQTADGNIYGVTEGSNDFVGALFQYTPSTNTYTKKFDFGGLNGTFAKGGMVLANGKLYGTTYSGGKSDAGILFEYNPATNTFSKKVDFTTAPNGYLPDNNMFLGTDQKLYGLMNLGGAGVSRGVLYQFDPYTKTITTKIEFDDFKTKGANPQSKLVQLPNGKIYGVTERGGSKPGCFFCGVIFEYDPIANSFLKKFDFDGGLEGNGPRGLTLAGNGKLYGMTYSGGLTSNGVLFEYDPATGTYTKKIDFDGALNGRIPNGNLTLATNGKLYGLTEGGGLNSKGVLFEFNPGDGSLTKKIDFDGVSSGQDPIGSLVLHSNGRLYGTTNSGGVNDLGVLFEFDPASSNFAPKINFDGTSKGSNPQGALLSAPNGKLYGYTAAGGTNTYGVIYEYDPATSVFIKTYDFTALDGAGIRIGSLVGVLPPVVTSFTPSSGSIGSTVIISGSNFSAVPSDNTVYFGATKGTVTAASTTQLSVTVPLGATYQPISVTVNGLIAYSVNPFQVTFPTDGTINASSFATNVDLTTGSNPISLGIEDMDGDGKSDLVVSNNLSNSVSVFKNVSTAGTIATNSFSVKADFGTATNPVGLAIGDLDGDGKQDVIVANSSSNSFSVLKNSSTSGSISLATKIDFATSSNPYAVAVGDVDSDGKSDLAVTRFNGGSGTTVSIFRNTSTFGSIEFAAKVDFNTLAGPNSVAIRDLNGDNKPELIVGCSGGGVSVFNNTSVAGDITTGSYASKIDFTTDPANGISIGDLDGDAKLDMVVPTTGTTVSIFRNTTSAGTITTGSFAPKVDLTASTSNISATIADFDGDTKLDLAIVSRVNSNLSIRMNVATSGSISASSFATGVDFPTGVGPGDAVVGDLDGDQRPEIVTVNNVSTTTNTISILRDKINFVVQVTDEKFIYTYDNGSGITVSITLSDASLVESVNFRSKGISEVDSGTKDVVVAGDGNKFEQIVPASDLIDPIGLQYYFEITTNDGVGLSSNGAAAYVKYKASEQSIPDLTFGNQVSNYSIIAVPLELTNKTVPTVFSALGTYDKTKWRLFDYTDNDNREYPGFGTIDIGKGYWLIARSNITINPGEGSTPTVEESAPFTINLSIGWNLIGNPYNFRISWPDVLTASSNPAGVDTKLKLFSGGTLTDGTVLDKYRGAFVFSSAAAVIKIPVTRNTTIGGRIKAEPGLVNSLDQNHWEVKLKLSEGILSNELGGIGMHPTATLKGKDPFDEVSVPLPEGLNLFELAYPHPEVFTDFNKEVVPTQENFTWNFDVKRSLKTSDLELTWANDYFGDNEKQLVLFDPSSLQVVDMRMVNQFTVTSRAEKLRILYGGKEYIQHALDKELPWLGNPYPNPAREELTIPFRVPESQDQMAVQIKIYNTLGAEVGMPVNGILAKGNYKITWQPQGETGLFIVRMKIGQQEAKATKVIIN